MTCDVFLRSYARDIAWVPYALRSINRFVSGIRNIIVVVPLEDLPLFKHLGLTREQLRTSHVNKGYDDYLVQQSDKLHADLYTDADYILMWDSDTVAIKPFSPTDLMIDGKPRCLHTPYKVLVDIAGKSTVPWQPITARAIGIIPEQETMRQHPFLIPAPALKEFQMFMYKAHGKPLTQYIVEQPNHEFSEFNCIGSWAYYFKPDLFSWWNTAEKGVPEPFVKQHWSWSGITPEVKSELDRILS